MYKLTIEDIKKIEKPAVMFGTVDFLPNMEDIPEQFKDRDNFYHRMTSAMFAGTKMPDGDMKFNSGFEELENNYQVLVDFITAHLRSWSPKHEHKIAGVAYMLSIILTVYPDKQ